MPGFQWALAPLPWVLLHRLQAVSCGLAAVEAGVGVPGPLFARQCHRAESATLNAELEIGIETETGTLTVNAHGETTLIEAFSALDALPAWAIALGPPHARNGPDCCPTALRRPGSARIEFVTCFGCARGCVERAHGGHRRASENRRTVDSTHERARGE